ncbi:MAG: phosphatase PAP2 family protein [Polyangiaceae bacterium]
MDKSLASVFILTGALLAPSMAHADELAWQIDQHFKIDPVTDIVLTGGAAGAAGITDLILSTGEIRPQPLPVNPTTMKVDISNLLPIDRGAVTQTIDPHASTYSDIGLYAALGFAVLDPILSGVRDGWDAGLVDAVMYAESLSLTLFVTDVTKIAVRRPRPLDYSNPNNTSDTNLQLSFFSGHASATASVTATATYLAFVRAPRTPRPWITLAAGTLLTAFVSYERVRSGNHFPTDVITGALAGGAIGVLVPHLHRRSVEGPGVWIGAAPAPGGGLLDLHGVF